MFKSFSPFFSTKITIRIDLYRKNFDEITNKITLRSIKTRVSCSKFCPAKSERFISREKRYFSKGGITGGWEEKEGKKMVRKDLESVETCCWRNVEAKVVVDGRWFEAEEKGWHISTWAFLKEENRKSRLVARMLSKPFGPPFATGIIGGGGSASATAILRFVSPQRPHNQQQQQQQVRELSPAT